MSIYESYAKYQLLDEADDDDNASNQGGQNIDLNANDDGGDQNDNNDQGNDQDNQDNNDDNQDQDNNDQNDDNQNQDNNDDNNQDDGDFDINSNTGDDGGDDQGNDAGGDNNLDDNNDQGEKEEPDNPQLDTIYDNLSEKEKAIKDYKLRQNILALHKSAGGMVEQLALLPKISQTNQQIKVLMTSLYAFRKYILFYVKNTYPSKTLLENTIQYYKYLGIMGTYRDIFKDLEKIMAHDIDKD